MARVHKVLFVASHAFAFRREETTGALPGSSERTTVLGRLQAKLAPLVLGRFAREQPGPGLRAPAGERCAVAQPRGWRGAPYESEDASSPGGDTATEAAE